MRKSLSLFIATLILLSTFSGTVGFASSNNHEYDLPENGAYEIYEEFFEFDENPTTLPDDAVVIDAWQTGRTSQQPGARQGQLLYRITFRHTM